MMNKLIGRISLACATAVGLMLPTSCSDDFLGEKEGDGNVRFTIELPAEFGATRAFGDGTHAENLTYAVYEQLGEGQHRLIEVSEHEIQFKDLKADVHLSLIKGKTYDIVFWADHKDNEKDKYYTFDAENMEINMNYDGIVQNAENRDAFFAAKTDFKVSGNYSSTVTLRRPFAQIDFGTRDLNEDAVVNWLPNLQTRMTTKGATTLNLLTGKVSNVKTIVYDLAAPPKGEIFPHQDQNPDGNGKPVMNYEYLSMDYILVPDVNSEDGSNQQVVDIAYEVYNGTDKVNEFPVSNVPVRRNYQTCIFGRLLTSATDFKVIIDPAFNLPHYDKTFLDWNEFALACDVAPNGSVIRLEHDIYFGEDSTEVGSNGEQICHDLRNSKLVIPVNQNITIDLNGHNMYNACIEVFGELTIGGEGKVYGQVRQANSTLAWNPVFGVRKSAYSSTPGKITITGGHYIAPKLSDGNSSAVLFDGPEYAGNIVIYGGTFEANPNNDGSLHAFPAYGGKSTPETIVDFHSGTWIDIDPRNNTDKTFASSIDEEGRRVYTLANNGAWERIYANGGWVQIASNMDTLDLTVGATRTQPLTINITGHVNHLILGDFAAETRIITHGNLSNEGIEVKNGKLRNVTFIGEDAVVSWNRPNLSETIGWVLDLKNMEVENLKFENITMNPVDFTGSSVSNITFHNTIFFSEGCPAIKMKDMKKAEKINIYADEDYWCYFNQREYASAPADGYLLQLEDLTGDVSINRAWLYDYAGGAVSIKTKGNVSVSNCFMSKNDYATMDALHIDGSAGMKSCSLLNNDLDASANGNRIWIVDAKDGCRLNVIGNKLNVANIPTQTVLQQNYGIRIDRTDGNAVNATWSIYGNSLTGAPEGFAFGSKISIADFPEDADYAFRAEN